jgi:hypothetical protein
MTRKTLAIFALLCPLLAHASLTEIRKDFLNETSLLSATPIITAPTVDATYLICVAASDVQSTMPTAILRWTDENGDFDSFAYPLVNGVPNGCRLIRNQAYTATTIETNGTYSGLYNLIAFGFGFWPAGTQAQGGITEPINYSVTGPNGGHEFGFPGYPWLFAVMSNPTCKWQLSAGWSGGISSQGTQIVTAYGGGNGMFTTLTGGCQYTMLTVQFGAPAAGTGPLTDYEYNLLNWTDATYPKFKTVFTTGSAAANVLLATNVAEVPNNGIVGEELLVQWNGQNSVPCAGANPAAPSGGPSSCVSLISIEANSSLELTTLNTPGQDWGTSPEYSAEVDAIQF